LGFTTEAFARRVTHACFALSKVITILFTSGVGQAFVAIIPNSIYLS
jgi:hypothetical protein